MYSIFFRLGRNHSLVRFVARNSRSGTIWAFISDCMTHHRIDWNPIKHTFVNFVIRPSRGNRNSKSISKRTMKQLYHTHRSETTWTIQMKFEILVFIYSGMFFIWWKEWWLMKIRNHALPVTCYVSWKQITKIKWMWLHDIFHLKMYFLFILCASPKPIDSKNKVRTIFLQMHRHFLIKLNLIAIKIEIVY